MEWKLKGNEVGREYNWNLNGMEYKCTKKNGMEMKWKLNGDRMDMEWK